MKKFVSLLLALMMALGMTALAEESKDQLARIQEKGEIVIATEGTWAPWTYTDENGTLVGFDVEIATAIAEKLGETFTFLMPASESIYLPFDFRTVCEQNRSYYDPEEETEEGVVITDAVNADAEEMAAYMEAQLTQSYQVYAKRSTAYYERLIKEYASDGGILKIYKKDGKITDIKIAAEAEEVDGGKPKIMIRIVDVRRMLMSLRLQSFMGTCFTVTDPIIEENNRCVMITGTEFSGVMLMDGKPENSEGTITVGALASLVFGVKTAEEICADGDAVMSERMKEELGKIIPLSRVYLNETV